MTKAMNRLLALAAALEEVTGVALMIEPALAARLLLGADVSGAGAAVGRVAGFALLSLGMACWPVRRVDTSTIPALWAMLTYNLLVTCYLTFIGIGGQWTGVLLWPAVVIHGLLTLLLGRAWLSTSQTQDTKG
jgi:hypothetical protein